MVLDGKVAIVTGAQRRIWAGITTGPGAAGPQMADSKLSNRRTRKQGNVTTQALYTDTALRAWKLVIAQLDKMFSSMSDEELLREVAPGRNRIFYLMGHLTAVHGRPLPMLDRGDGRVAARRLAEETRRGLR